MNRQVNRLVELKRADCEGLVGALACELSSFGVIRRFRSHQILDSTVAAFLISLNGTAPLQYTCRLRILPLSSFVMLYSTSKAWSR